MKRMVKSASIALGTCVMLALMLFVLDKQREVQAQKGHQHDHKAYHEGSLNVIDSCSVGHVEVTLKDNVICLWFVGGDNNTGSAVRIPDTEIGLEITIDSKTKKTLLLKPKPIELAEEKVGDCSRFEATEEWLRGITEFEATGKVNFKGKTRVLRIDYPHGKHQEHDNHDIGHDGHEHKG